MNRLVQKTYYLELFKSRTKGIFAQRRHLVVTVFQRPRRSHLFSFNPKNKVIIITDEALDSFFVTVFGTKNVIFVTSMTKRPCNLLIINYAYRVEKSLWKVHVLLHREVIARN